MSALEVHKAVMDQKWPATEWKPRPVSLSHPESVWWLLFLKASVRVRFVHLLVTPSTRRHLLTLCYLGLRNICRLEILLPIPSPAPSLPVEVKKEGRNKAEGKEALLF